MWSLPEHPRKKGKHSVLHLYVLRSFEFIRSDIWIVGWIFHHLLNYFDYICPHLKCAQELFLDFGFLLFFFLDAGQCLPSNSFKILSRSRARENLVSTFWLVLFQLCSPPGLGLLSSDSRMWECKACWSKSSELACLGSQLKSVNGKLKENIDDYHQVTEFTFFLPRSLSLISVSF